MLRGRRSLAVNRDDRVPIVFIFPALFFNFRHLDIAYSFRPLSYWEIPGSPLELVLRNVKGTKRREMIRDLYEQGRLDQLVPVLAADELSDEDREGLGAI